MIPLTTQQQIENCKIFPRYFTFESWRVQSLKTQEGIVQLMADLYEAGVEEDNLELLGNLQVLHDTLPAYGTAFTSKASKRELRCIAEKFDLEIPPWLS